MKIRNGFVSNSSSSSFVVLKDILSKLQVEQIKYYSDWVDTFIKTDSTGELANKFSYADEYSWTIKEYDDFIFGETSMDNFSMCDFLEHINVDDKYVCWDEGYRDEPYQSQLDFIQKIKYKARKPKLERIDMTNKQYAIAEDAIIQLANALSISEKDLLMIIEDGMNLNTSLKNDEFIDEMRATFDTY